MGNLSNNTSGLQRILEAVEGLSNANGSKTVSVTITTDVTASATFCDENGVLQNVGHDSSSTVNALEGLVFCYSKNKPVVSGNYIVLNMTDSSSYMVFKIIEDGATLNLSSSK